MVTIEKVKELRDMTGISIGQCKKALEEANGDIEKARVILSKKGGEIALKKSDRELNSGVIASYVHSGKVGAMIEIACETDFVAKNEEFQKIAYDIAMQVAAANPSFLKKEEISDEDRKKAMEVFEEEVKGKPEDLKEKILKGKLDSYFKDRILLEQPYIKNPEMTVANLIEGATHKFGEKIVVVKFVRYSI